jgi:hypothetical protein
MYMELAAKYSLSRCHSGLKTETSLISSPAVEHKTEQIKK